MGGTVIDIGGKKPCNQCGHEPGGHEETCSRHPERMRQMAVRREADYKSGAKPRPRRNRKVRLSQRELDELKVKSASEMLYGDRHEAVELLRRQMRSKDEKVAQRAALEILAYTDGKPTQKIEQTTDQITEVVYRTAALAHEEFVPGAADAG